MKHVPRGLLATVGDWVEFAFLMTVGSLMIAIAAAMVLRDKDSVYPDDGEMFD